jgi:hypothetical protein
MSLTYANNLLDAYTTELNFKNNNYITNNYVINDDKIKKYETFQTLNTYVSYKFLNDKTLIQDSTSNNRALINNGGLYRYENELNSIYFANSNYALIPMHEWNAYNDLSVSCWFKTNNFAHGDEVFEFGNTFFYDTTNMIAWYKFDTPQSLLVDSFGNNIITVTGGAPTCVNVSPRIGTGNIYFLSSADYINLPINIIKPSGVSRDVLSVSFWMRKRENIASGYKCYFSIHDDINANSSYVGHIFFGKTSGQNYQIHLRYGANFRDTTVNRDQTILNEWEHYVLIIRKTNIGGTNRAHISFYVNGSYFVVYNNDLDWMDYSTFLSFNRWKAGEGSGNHSHEIDDVRFYNRVLTSEEVNILYNAYNVRLRKKLNNLAFEINDVVLYETPHTDNTWTHVYWNVVNGYSTQGFIKINNGVKNYFNEISLQPNLTFFPPAPLTGFTTTINGIVYRACSFEYYTPETLVAWQAFDRNTSTRFCTNASYSSTGALNVSGVSFGNDTSYKGIYLGIDMGQLMVMRYYTITASGSVNRKPKNWKIYGTNNIRCWNNLGGTNATGAFYTGPEYDWIEIDARTNQTSYTNNTRWEMPNNYNSYRFYAMNVNAIITTDGYLDFTEWSIYGFVYPSIYRNTLGNATNKGNLLLNDFKLFNNANSILVENEIYSKPLLDYNGVMRMEHTSNIITIPSANELPMSIENWGIYNDLSLSLWFKTTGFQSGDTILDFTCIDPITSPCVEPVKISSSDSYIAFLDTSVTYSLRFFQDTVCDILVIGGGGAGGGNTGGGGGAGGVVYQKGVTFNASTYTITVGAGGTAPALPNPNTTATATTTQQGNDGASSSISVNGTLLQINGITYEGKGGGGGGTFGGAGRNGGSSGGGSVDGAAVSKPPGTPTQGLTYFNGTTNVAGGNSGFAGGTSQNSVFSGGGGGGAGAGGSSTTYGGNGAAGVQINVTGANQWYAAGGAGGFISTSTSYVGGSGIGGDGTRNGNAANSLVRPARNFGVNGTGSGGGGGGYDYYGWASGQNGTGGGAGGSGIVIIRYSTSEKNVKYPKQAITANPFTYTDGSGTVINIKVSSYHTINTEHLIFNEIYYTTGWLSAGWMYQGANATSTDTTLYFNNDTTFYGDWVMVDLGVSIVLSKYRIYPRNDVVTYSPKDFRIYATNDTTSFSTPNTKSGQWVLLDTQTDITTWTENNYKEFVTSSVTQSYRYFAIIANKLNNPTEAWASFGLSEWELYETKSIPKNIIIKNNNNQLTFQINNSTVYQTPLLQNTWNNVVWNINNSVLHESYINLNSNISYFNEVLLTSNFYFNKLGSKTNQGKLEISDFKIVTTPLLTSYANYRFDNLLTFDNSGNNRHLIGIGGSNVYDNFSNCILLTKNKEYTAPSTNWNNFKELTISGWFKTDDFADNDKIFEFNCIKKNVVPFTILPPITSNSVQNIDNEYYVAFTDPNITYTVIFPQNLTCQLFMIGGGGGGGYTHGGGGGAGAYYYNTNYTFSSGKYKFYVGGGGGQSSSGGDTAIQQNGSDILVNGLQLRCKGGAGANGNAGGCGSGGLGWDGDAWRTAGYPGGSTNNTGTVGSGNAGGSSVHNYSTGQLAGGGGGGIGSIGGNAYDKQAGRGGNGLIFTIKGFEEVYGGGGAGGGWPGNTTIIPTLGGGANLLNGAYGIVGGSGHTIEGTPGGNGAVNTGSGGGSAKGAGGSVGGSGVIILRFIATLNNPISMQKINNQLTFLVNNSNVLSTTIVDKSWSYFVWNIVNSYSSQGYIKIDQNRYYYNIIPLTSGTYVNKFGSINNVGRLYLSDINIITYNDNILLNTSNLQYTLISLDKNEYALDYYYKSPQLVNNVSFSLANSNSDMTIIGWFKTENSSNTDVILNIDYKEYTSTNILQNKNAKITNNQNKLSFVLDNNILYEDVPFGLNNWTHIIWNLKNSREKSFIKVNNKTKLTYNNSVTSKYGKYPRYPATSETYSYPDGTNVRISGSSSWDTTTHSFYQSFNHNITDIGWASGASKYNTVSGIAISDYRFEYPGEYIQIDLGESILLVHYKIHNRRGWTTRAPKTFRIYASNDDNCWTNINNANWILIDERINVSYANYIAEFTVYNTVSYRYYALIIYSNYMDQHVQFAEWELYGVPGYFFVTLGSSTNLGKLYVGDFRMIDKYIASYQTDLLYKTYEKNVYTYNLLINSSNILLTNNTINSDNTYLHYKFDSIQSLNVDNSSNNRTLLYYNTSNYGSYSIENGKNCLSLKNTEAFFQDDDWSKYNDLTISTWFKTENFQDGDTIFNCSANVFSSNYYVILSNSGSDLVNFQIKLTITYQPIFRNDFRDVRILDTDNTILSYYIENVISASSADIWVKVPIFSNNKILRIISGNEPNIGDPNTVFDLYDNFNILDATKWKLSTAWNSAGIAPSVENGYLKCTRYTNDGNVSGIESTSNIPLDAVVELKTCAIGTQTIPAIFFRGNHNHGNNYGIQARYDTRGGAGAGLGVVVNKPYGLWDGALSNGSSTAFPRFASSSTVEPIVWYQFNDDPSTSFALTDNNSYGTKYNMTLVNYARKWPSTTVSWTLISAYSAQLNGYTGTLSGQSYGNGTYILTASSGDSGWALSEWFSGTSTIGPHLGGYTVGTGIYSGNFFIVSDYKGQWVKIELPSAIILTSIKLYQRMAGGGPYTGRAPLDYRLYGSNDNTNWTMILNVTGATYNASYVHTGNVTNVSTAYSKFAIVVNKLPSNTDGNLQLDEWELYGSPQYILKTTGYTTNNYLYQSAYQNYGIISTESNNLYLSYNGTSTDIQTMLNTVHSNNGFTIHFIFRTSNITSVSQILFIGNTASIGHLIRVYIVNSSLVFKVGYASVSTTIALNTYYVTDLLFSYVAGDKITLCIYLNNVIVATTNSVVYGNLLSNVSTTGLVYYLGRYTKDDLVVPITGLTVSNLYLVGFSTLVTNKTLTDTQYQLGPNGGTFTVTFGVPSAPTSLTQGSTFSTGCFVSNGTNTLGGYTIPRGYQVWKVPVTGTYEFVVAGAQGASYTSSSISRTGGLGATIKTSVRLTKGDNIIILVGIQPIGDGGSQVAGGGGGTFITKYAATNAFNILAQHTIIAVAGGGGGVGNTASNYNGVNASFATSGTLPNGVTGVTVATNGGGGGGGAFAGGNAANGTSADSIANSGGGGGFIGDGGHGWTTGNDDATQETTGGKSFLNGCAGGFGIGTGTLAPEGGFGGGGGSWNAGGGAGGYSGGTGAAQGNRVGGGGGGSYDMNGPSNNATAYTSSIWESSKFGTVRSDANGYNSGDGYVLVYFEDEYAHSTSNTLVPVTLQDFRIYPSVLTTTFINSLQTGQADIPTPQNAYDFVNSTTNLQAWYKFDDVGTSINSAFITGVTSILMNSVSNTSIANLQTYRESTNTSINYIQIDKNDYKIGNSSLQFTGGTGINTSDLTYLVTTNTNINFRNNLTISNGLSISFWVKIPSGNLGHYGKFIHHQNFHIQKNAVGSGNGAIVVNLSNSVGTTESTITVMNNATTSSVWELWTLSFQYNTTTSVNFYFYRNNTLEKTQTNVTWSANSSTSSFYIGGYPGTQTNMRECYLDDYRIYNKVLSATEVSYLFTVGNPWKSIKAQILGNNIQLWYEGTSINNYGFGTSANYNTMGRIGITTHFDGSLFVDELKVYKATANTISYTLTTDPVHTSPYVAPTQIPNTGDYYIAFTESSLTYTVTFAEDCYCQVFMIGGGGGGGWNHDGAGGAGAYYYDYYTFTKGTYTFKVGNGGYGQNYWGSASSGEDTYIQRNNTDVIINGLLMRCRGGGRAYVNASTANGLRYHIYDGYYADDVNWFQGKGPTQTGIVTDFTSISTATGGNKSVDGSDLYSVMWYGYFYATVSGTWTFYTVSDDASYLWIGPTAATGYSTGNALVKNGGLHPMNEASGTINLIQGAYYPIRIQFGENSSGDNITVSFTPPGGTRTYNGTGYFYVNIGSTSGGCGGGGMGWDGNTAGSRTYPGGAALNTATIGKGNYGGAGNNYHAAGQLAGGGGGGIGGIGPSASGVNPGRGGNGMVINIKGFEEVYGGGGGGGGWPGYTNIVPTPGGSATLSDGRVVTVGGTGQTVEGTAGGPGATNTGSGGGSAKGAAGGSGGSGIIIIRFEKNLLALQRLNNKLSFQINKIPIYEVPYVDNTWYYILWNIRNSTSTKGFIKINNNTRVYFVQLPLLSCISKNKLGTLINKGSLYLSNFVILTIPITTELESQLYNVTIDNVFIDNTIYTEYLRNLSALYFNSVKKLEAKSYGVNVLGSLFTTGNVVTYSDMRLKNVIGNIEDPLEKLDNINTFKYLPNDIGMQYCLENKVSVGVSAQDVQKVLPEIVTLAPFDTSNLDDGTIVSKSGNHYLSVSYEKLVPLLLECVKELKEEIDYINF